MELMEFLQSRVGDHLRTVVILREARYDVVYLNDNIRDKYSRESFSDVVDAFRLDKPFLNPGTNQQPLGERKAVVHYHENAFVLQFPFSEDDSILVSLDRETGRDLLEFIEECRRRVEARQ